MLIGSRLGPYEVLAKLGEGGMGEVYKARDTRLNRTVAVKVLPPELAADPERRARFEREAHAIAALSHPHICTIHDVGRENGTDYLVMELLEGETLADRLANGSGVWGPGSTGQSQKPKAQSLPINDVLRYAIEIADALDKAHRAGIVHRDLKPANIMLTKSGAKLLDFGLAKLKGPAVPISMTAIEHATTSGPKTATGTILGTMHYMSPEQVEGRETDARSDLWALGVVIYEMATGSRPFEGESAASIIGAILKDTPPPLSARQPLSPEALDDTVSRCLAKDPDERWQSAADLRNTLKWISSQRTPSSTPVPQAAARRRGLGMVTLASILAFAIGLGAGWRLLAPAPLLPPPVQFDVLPPIDAALSPAPVASAPQLAISPDGRLVAFVAAKRRGASQIYLRAVDGRDVRVLADTDGASFPFWSADGRYIGFFAGRKLKKISVSGGTSEALCDAPAGRGGTWNADGVIVFSATPNTGLVRISAAGGAVSPVSSVHRGESQEVIGHNWPYFLPDGRHFLYYQRSANPDTSGIYIAELDTSFISPRVLPTPGMAVLANGYLAFVKDGTLLAQPFDQRSLRVTGEPLRIADHVGYFSGTFGYSAIAASPANLLAYGGSVGTTSRLMWIGRDGKPGEGLGNPGIYLGPRLSPDQRTVIVAAAGETMADRDLWGLDVARNTASRVTSDPSADWFPAWAPDNRTIFFGSGRTGITSIFQRVGLGQEEPLTSHFPYAAYPGDVSSDGRFLAYTLSTERAYDIGVMSIDTRKMTPFLATSFSEIQPRFAPNMRWLAYSSDESGQFEVYVRPYPSADALWKISIAGGAQPEWRRDGKEIFYVATDGKMMAVPVSITGEFEARTPRPLFDIEMPEATGPYPNHYTVTAEGQRFLVNTVIDQPNRPALTVLLNWTAGLKK